MKRRINLEKAIRVLREMEVLQSQGDSVTEACRKLGIKDHRGICGIAGDTLATYRKLRYDDLCKTCIMNGITTGGRSSAGQVKVERSRNRPGGVRKCFLKSLAKWKISSYPTALAISLISS